MVLPLPDLGSRVTDYSALQNAISYENQLGFLSSQVALGTNQATALVISTLVNPALVEFTTVASGTGCTLPLAIAGNRIGIANNGSNTLTVYTNANEVSPNKIGTTAGATGVSVNSGTNAQFTCMGAGQWYKLSGT